MMPGSILELPAPAKASAVSARSRRLTATTWIRHILLGLAAIFYALHFLHLRADFPNHSPWMDWAKYTDEGWYGDAAIRHYEWGHWNVPGDFNPAAALPVWPVIEMVLFRFTGVSLVAARVLTVLIFGLICLAAVELSRRWSAKDSAHAERSVAGAMAVLLLVTNPFCFVFTRMAILEPLLVLLTLSALLTADWAGRFVLRPSRVRWVPAALLGVLLTLIVLTKTTGLFLFPAIFYVLWGSVLYQRKPFLRSASLSAGIAGVLWLAYYGFFVRRHFLADYKYLFSANTYTKITLGTFWPVLHDTLLDGTWIGNALFWSSLIALLAWIGITAARRFRGSPVPVALVLWVLGYAAFLAYHANFAPRYYTVIAVPLILLLAMGFDALLGVALDGTSARTHRVWQGGARVAAFGSAIALLVIVVNGSRHVVHYATHPQYTFVTAVRHLRDAIQRDAGADPHHSRLILSISGSDISMITGLPSICDDFGVMELPDRVATYKPGWFAAWNYVEDDKMAALAPMYRLVKVGAYPAYDDPVRNLLILYRLDPLNSPRRGRNGRRRYFINPHQRRHGRAGATTANTPR